MPVKKSEESVMELVRNLLARANGTNSESERLLCLKQANKLMVKHAIDQAMLNFERSTFEKRKPVQLVFPFWDQGNDEFSYEFRMVLGQMAETNRCKVALLGHPERVTLVGMNEDVEWVQMLWMNVLLDFFTKLHPRWNADDTIGANVLRLKEAGFPWARIWQEAKRVQPEIDTQETYDPQKCRYLMAHYKAEQRRTGREHVGTQRFEAYRFSFAQGYVQQLCVRLEEMREANRGEEAAVPGSALALVSMEKEIEEEFYRMFPSMRPPSPEEMDEARRIRIEKQRQLQEEDRDFLASLSEEERKKVLRARAAEAEKKSREDERYWRRVNAQWNRLNDDAGAQAGRLAAKEVDLSRSAKVDSETRKAIG